MVRVGRDAVKVIWRAARLTSRGLEPVVLRGRGKRGAPPRLILICMSSLPSQSVFVHPSAGTVCVNASNVESVKAKGEGGGAHLGGWAPSQTGVALAGNSDSTSLMSGASGSKQGRWGCAARVGGNLRYSDLTVLAAYPIAI